MADSPLRLVFGNLALAVLLLRSAVTFFRNPSQELRPTVYFVSLCFAVIGAVNLVQIVAVLAVRDPGYYLDTKPAYLSLYRLAYTGLMVTLLQLSYSRFQYQLAERAREMKLLVSEMHHRTKNNLALVGSLISLESAEFSEDQAVLEALDRISARIGTIALLHERLQHSALVRSVCADDYLSDILELTPLRSKDGRITVGIKREIDRLELDIKTAIPLGLIVNELVTNAMKHAFPGDRAGSIRVRFARHDDQLELTVHDDGIGMPANPREGAMGMSLIRALSAQLGGKPSWESSRGTRFALPLPIPARAC